MYAFVEGVLGKTRWLRSGLKPPEAPAGPAEGLSRKVLEIVRETLKVEPEWSIQHRNGFTWWPGRLGQHVWTETSPDTSASWPIRLCLEADLLRDVDWTTPALAELSASNKAAVLGGLVADVKGKRLCCRSTVYVSAETLALKTPVIRLAASLQPGRAQQAAEGGWDRRFAGKLHVSPHPSLGLRRSGHAVLSRPNRLLRSAGDLPPAFGAPDFESLKKMSPEPWTLATARDGSFTAEFPYASWKPSYVSRPPEGTSVLRITNDQPHADFGSGALVRLTLPLRLDTEECSKRSARLNFCESHEWTGFDFIGAWHGDPPSGTVTWATFLPSALQPLDVLKTLVWGVSARARWARSIGTNETAASG